MNENILIVDDEKEIADLIEVYLKNDGYTVHKFYNGMDALKCIESQNLDLAILETNSTSRGLTDFAHIEEEYLATIDSLNWPDGITLPDKLEDEDTGASFQVGYGETRASYLWEYSWMKEWLDTYNTDPERAEKALEELEKAFDMPYMGIDRCDDATRNYLRENIDKAKLGDPSGFTESIRANYAN